MIDITGLREDKRPQSSAIVHALLDRLEAAEADALEQARLNGMGSEREAALMAKLEAAEKSDAESLAMYRRVRDERDNLRAKITEMEKQEPVVEVQWAAGIPNGILDFISTDGYLPKLGDKLYALPGAKGEEK